VKYARCQHAGIGVPSLGDSAASSGRESVAEKRWSWFPSKSCVCVCGGRDCVLERNWNAVDTAEGIAGLEVEAEAEVEAEVEL
jgi:hypothetical protein